MHRLGTAGALRRGEKALVHLEESLLGIVPDASFDDHATDVEHLKEPCLMVVKPCPAERRLVDAADFPRLRPLIGGHMTDRRPPRVYDARRKNDES